MPDSPPVVALHVIDVRLAVPAGPGVEAGMIELAESGPLGRRLRIVVGRAEAAACAAAWRGEVPPRPSTWDLFVSTVAVLDGRFTTATITAVEQRRHWFAALELERGELRRAIACRPSDAINVALRSPATALVAPESVMVLGGVLADGSPAPAPSADDDGESISFT